MRQLPFRGAVWLSVCQENRCSRGLLHGDRVVSGLFERSFELYAKDLWSIGAVARHLNQRGVPPRFGRGPWERSTIWGMLRNPVFGKTERAQRQRITKPLRAKGGFPTRSSANRERDPQEWITVPVPALVSEETFAMAQERLIENKRLSARRTKAPTLLRGCWSVASVATAISDFDQDQQTAGPIFIAPLISGSTTAPRQLVALRELSVPRDLLRLQE